MEQWTPPMSGTLRVTNLRTLRRWVEHGMFQLELDAGYKYAPGCGRFTTEQCTCSKCRRRPNISRRLIVENKIPGGCWPYPGKDK